MKIPASATKPSKSINNNWENEIDVLDAVKESERIRNKIFNNESIQDDKISIKKQKVK